MKKLTLVLFVLFAFAGCKDKSVESPGDDQPIISSSLKVIDSTDYMNHFESISGDSTTYTFSKGSSVIDNLASDNFIISTFNKGVFRKITSVSYANNKVVLSTSDASLTDVIQQGKAEFTGPLQAEYIYDNRNGKLLADLIDASFDFGSNYKISGRLNLTSDFHFDIDFKNWGIKKFEYYIKPTLTTELKGEITLLNQSFHLEETWLTVRLRPVIVYISFVPIVIIPEFKVLVGIDGQVKAVIVSKITQVDTFKTGLRYENNTWYDISEKTHSFTFEPPTFSAEASVTAYVKPNLEIMLYGILGPYINTKLYSEFLFNAVNTNAELNAGILVSCGGVFRILDKQFDIYNKDVLSYKQKIWESSLSDGKISGSIKDAVTYQPLQDVEIKIYKNSQYIKSGYSNNYGTYEISLAPYDNYTVNFEKSGYIPETYYSVKVTAFNTTNLQAVLKVNQQYSGYGNVSGKVINAINGDPISSVSLYFRRGINDTLGTVVASATTLSTGNYTCNNLQAGNYTVEAARTGYVTNYFSVVVIGGQTAINQNVSLSPDLNSGEYRIVLTWGSSPEDLDSHTSGPLPGGGTFHMYYPYANSNSGSPWPNVVTLDLDDVSSYGPETTTLYNLIPGQIYKFFVHDYTNRNSNSSYALSNSSALVRVFNSTGMVGSYYIPPNRGGTLWYVFDLTASGIVEKNIFSYVSDPSLVGTPTSPVKYHKDNKNH